MGKSSTSQTATFAFGDDDGSESGHTLDTENANRTAQLMDIAFLIRMQIQETAGGVDNGNYAAFAQKNGAGGFTQVNPSRTDGLVLTNDTQGRSDNESTTERLSAGSGTWASGLYDDGTSATGTESGLSLSNNYTELEFCISGDSANLSDGDYFDIRVEFLDGTDLASYSTLPRVTFTVGAQTHEEAVTVAIYQAVAESTTAVFEKAVTLDKFGAVAEGNIATLENDATAAIFKAVSQIGGLSFETDFTLARFASASFESIKSVEVALSVAKYLGISLDTLLTAEDSLTLDRFDANTFDMNLILAQSIDLGIALATILAGGIQFESAFSLDRVTAVGLESMITKESAVSLARAMGLSPVPDLNFETAIVASRILAVASTHTLDVATYFALAKQLSTAQDAVLTIEEQAVLDRILSITNLDELIPAGLPIETFVTITKAIGASASAQVDFANAIALAKALAVAQDTLQVHDMTIQLGYNNAITLSGTFTLESALTIIANFAIQQIGEYGVSDFLAFVTLADAYLWNVALSNTNIWSVGLSNTNVSGVALDTALIG